MLVYDVKLAYNGQAGLELYQEFAPDIILLDLHACRYCLGQICLEQLRAKDWGKNIRVIVLTNISRSEAPAKTALPKCGPLHR